MKRARLRPSAVVVLASIACAFLVAGLVFGLTEAARATPAHLAPIRTVVFDCPGQLAPLVRPRTFILTCADANSDLGQLSWSSWTPGLASATGTLEENDCTPYCAVGHFHAYPAVVVLWGVAAVKNHPGEHSYTNMTLILTGARPRYYDYLARTWVTAPATQTSRLLTSPGALSPRA
ncbi:MAG: hypothetical protein M3Z75_10315 [Actinomycetota bacterium]|nr:hypothetical protein [Actinomycetota bacterium]